ncbi:unnamed protein product [Colletotrichum noveboracense]|uniref:Uncharacterized protein n=1 Tax=Colletotrichum noveboracense TaxID=2664923 RepID=A0A9W4S8B0_9PEZI|nr:unnamed protein product [Colletotrichum noveboracense]
MNTEETKAFVALAKYAVGQQMILRPFPKPCTEIAPEPATTMYGCICCEDVGAEYLDNFTPEVRCEDDEMAKLDIVDVISGGLKHSRQYLLCKATNTPRGTNAYAPIPAFNDKKQYVVALVQDRVCYGDLFSEEAGQKLFQRSAVQQRIHERTKTGFGTINPEYYGTWILETIDDAESLPGRKRHVGVILMEHLEGQTIEQLCTREWAPKDEEGDLIPPSRPILRSAADGSITLLDVTDVKVRNEIVMHIMHGMVTNAHVGAYLTGPVASNFMIVFRRGGELLTKPQAVIINNLCTQMHIWRNGRKYSHENLYELVEKPLHPFDRFWTGGDLELLDGWHDLSWRLEYRVKFEAWMLRQFGLMDESEENRRYCTEDDLQENTYLNRHRDRRLMKAFSFIVNGGTRDFDFSNLPAPQKPATQKANDSSEELPNTAKQKRLDYGFRPSRSQCALNGRRERSLRRKSRSTPAEVAAAAAAARKEAETRSAKLQFNIENCVFELEEQLNGKESAIQKRAWQAWSAISGKEPHEYDPEVDEVSEVESCMSWNSSDGDEADADEADENEPDTRGNPNFNQGRKSKRDESDG